VDLVEAVLEVEDVAEVDVLLLSWLIRLCKALDIWVPDAPPKPPGGGGGGMLPSMALTEAVLDDEFDDEPDDESDVDPVAVLVP
jgi:hypothetical protein